MDSGFYRAFEDKHRGSRELIKSRLRVYLPFLTALLEVYNDCKALDVGCGRGEWLELVTEMGFDAHGVDLDDGMLAACRELGLSVENREAVAYIKSVPSQSLGVVSGFHFAEHIPFTNLQVFVREALRVLKPAGLLILETPNPENIVVGTSSFYLDPTHEHPIPPELLAFLPEYYGFYRTKILRLQETQEVVENTVPSLIDVLSGVSPDYSIVSQKNAPKNKLRVFDQLFEVEHGITLDVLAARYDRQTDLKLNEVHIEVKRLQSEKEQLRFELNTALFDRARIRSEANRLQNELTNLRREISSLQAEMSKLQIESTKLFAENQHLHQTVKTLDRELSRVMIELQSVYTSTSWRITAPIRLSKNFLRALGNFPNRGINMVKSAIKNILARVIRFIRAHPSLKGKLVQFLSHFPVLDKMMLRISRKVLPEQRFISDAEAPSAQSSPHPPQLSEPAQEIYKRLIDEEHKKS